MHDARPHTRRRPHRAAALALACALAPACGETTDAGDGELTVLIEPEGVIIDGLDPGDAPESVRDGWRVRFDRYIVVVGAIDMHLSTDASVEVEDPRAFAVDLTRVPFAGEPLWTLSNLVEGRWEFFYATRGAQDGAERHDSVEAADFDEMTSEDYTYLIDATITKDDGVSCPPSSLANVPGSAVAVGENHGGDSCYPNPAVRLRLGAQAETAYGPCELDGAPGVNISAGGAQAVAITIHGDHLFFNGFPEGDEGGTLRLAQWLADCDLDLDGEVTRAELEAVAPADLPELDDRFQLGGSPITPLESMWDYTRAQLKTQGHFQGEGECPADGVGHEH